MENFNGPRSPARYGSFHTELLSNSTVPRYSGSSRRPRVNSGGSDLYYEDVDPKFALDETAPPLPLPIPEQHQHRVPSTLTPRPLGAQYRPDSLALPPSHSYEDLPGARSPAESETSNFTSVSQRGVNPNWRPGNGGEFNSFGPIRRLPNRDQQMRRDVLLAGNPDFEIPGMGPPARMGPRGGRGGGGMMRGPPPQRLPPPGTFDGSSADGRYPMPVGAGPPMPPMNMSNGVREI